MQSKFKLLALALLSTTFFLTSCGDSASNPTTPSNQVTDNSTNLQSHRSILTKKTLQHHLIKKMMQVQIGTHQKKK